MKYENKSPITTPKSTEIIGKFSLEEKSPIKSTSKSVSQLPITTPKSTKIIGESSPEKKIPKKIITHSQRIRNRPKNIEKLALPRLTNITALSSTGKPSEPKQSNRKTKTIDIKDVYVPKESKSRDFKIDTLSKNNLEKKESTQKKSESKLAKMKKKYNQEKNLKKHRF